jgi:hypothetical protein
LQTRPITDSAYNKLGPTQTGTMIIYILKQSIDSAYNKLGPTQTGTMIIYILKQSIW